jgi:RNA polymerase sigma-70 factor (ECF subfamily)
MIMVDYLHSDDDLLVKLSLEGDSRAYAEIVRRYEDMVAGIVKGMLGNIQQAEDVGQDTFIRLFYSLSSFRGDSKLSTYIQRIAINLSLNEIKRGKRFVSLFARSSNEDYMPEKDIPDTHHYTEEDNDIKEVIEKAIATLPPDYKAVVVLRLIQGYSSKESAEILEVPIGTVLSRLSRAREQLQNEINKLM